ncbi:MAG: restriction endonuclease subunit S [Bilifractor sp.]
MPDSWEVMPVSEYCLETKSGATPSRDITEYWENGTVPWLKSGEVHNGITIETEEFITELAVNNSSTKVLPSDTVLMAMYGVTAGEVGYLAIPCTTNQAVCGMVCRTKVESAYLFFALLQNQQEASRLSNGGAQDNLSKGFIDNILIVVPNRDVLSNLGLTTLINQIKQNTKEILLLTTMQDTLLAQLSSR